VDLDALIVAVGGAAGVGDLRDLARRRFHHHGGGVDIAGLAYGGVHEVRCYRVHLHRFLAEQKARHVEVVDHHVPKEPAGAREVIRRRRRWIA
jgi:hypothetical protein